MIPTHRLTVLPARARPLRILLVEDSAADADLLVAMLMDELPDAVVSVSSSVADALPLLTAGVDIVITDLSLPDADGLQALTAILAEQPDIAVVVMTGRRDHALALSALAEGAEDYLVKGDLDSRAVAQSVLYAAARHQSVLDGHAYERLALSLLDSIEASTCAVDHDGTIVAVNRAWRDFAATNGGDPDRTAVGQNYLEVCQASEGADTLAAMQVHAGLHKVLAGQLDRLEVEYPCHDPSGDRWFSLRINPLPEIAGAVLTHVDVSASKRAEQALSHLTLHDALTGLPNRTLLMDRLGHALAASTREHRQVGVAFLDIDQFKRVNDSLGHPAGDELLRAVAERLSAHLRSGDTLSRFAGDEFVVVWPSVRSAAEAEMLAGRLVDCFAEPFQLEGAATALTVSFSVGVAVGAPPQSADDLLLAADAAMYQAKRQGRGLICMYTAELRAGAESRLRTEQELHAAIAARQFVLHYQPVVDLQHEVVTGVEALVRWQHPDGLRMPDTFIPVAESSGLIVPLGAWVIDEACRQAAEWRSAGVDLTMAVNLSARQVSHPDIVDTVQQALHRSGLAPHHLLVEVTESAVMDDAESALKALTALADLGVLVAIDDFGTGYSSLVYLKRYPLHALKIDRSFVAGMGSCTEDDAIVATITGLARAVGATSVAEGVETSAQREALTDLGCEFAQGYLFSRPVPADQLVHALVRCASVLSAPATGPRRQLPSTAGLPDPSVIARIHQLHLSDCSVHTIAAALNHEEGSSAGGTRWHGTAVAKLVQQLWPDVS